jgi:hypothetical protein
VVPFELYIVINGGVKLIEEIWYNVITHADQRLANAYLLKLLKDKVR